MENRLYRSRDNRMLTGVCGGLGEFFGLDPTLIRIVFAVLTVAGLGTFVVIYVVLALIIPPRPLDDELALDADSGATMPELQPAVDKLDRMEEGARAELADDE